jgi:hypothetical protein
MGSELDESGCMDLEDFLPAHRPRLALRFFRSRPMQTRRNERDGTGPKPLQQRSRCHEEVPGSVVEGQEHRPLGKSLLAAQDGGQVGCCQSSVSVDRQVSQIGLKILGVYQVIAEDRNSRQGFGGSTGQKEVRQGAIREAQNLGSVLAPGIAQPSGGSAG